MFICELSHGSNQLLPLRCPWIGTIQSLFNFNQLTFTLIIPFAKTCEFVKRDGPLHLKDVHFVVGILAVLIIHYKVSLILPWVISKTNLI